MKFAPKLTDFIPLPAALNGFGLWLGLMVGLTIVNYGFPIVHLLATPGTAVPAIDVGARQ